MDPAYDTGISNKDGLTNLRTFRVIGTALRDVPVTVTAFSSELNLRTDFNVRSDSDGNYSTGDVVLPTNSASNKTEWIFTAVQNLDGNLSIISPDGLIRVDLNSPSEGLEFSGFTISNPRTRSFMNLLQYFDLQFDEPLLYTATSSDESVATVEIVQDGFTGVLSVTGTNDGGGFFRNNTHSDGRVVGSSDITITATDDAGNVAIQNTNVRVIPILVAPRLVGSLDSAPEISLVADRDQQEIFTSDGKTTFDRNLEFTQKDDESRAVGGATVVVTLTEVGGSSTPARTLSRTTTAGADGHYFVEISESLPGSFGVFNQGEWDVTARQSGSAPSLEPLRLVIDGTSPNVVGPTAVGQLSSPQAQTGYVNAAQFQLYLANPDGAPLIIRTEDWEVDEANVGVLHSIIRGNNRPECTTTPNDGEGTRIINVIRALTLADVTYQNNTAGFGQHWLCATTQDETGNAGSNSVPVGPIILDTIPPAFVEFADDGSLVLSQPDVIGAALNGVIADRLTGQIFDGVAEGDERTAENIINAKNQFPEDIVSYAVLSDNPGSCAQVSRSRYKVSSNKQFSAQDLLTADGRPGNAYVCVRISDRAGNDPAYSQSPLVIQKDLAAPRLPTPVFDPAGDTGVLGDFLTKNTDFTITGTGAAVGATINVIAFGTFADGTTERTVAVTTANTDESTRGRFISDYSATLKGLSEGTWEIVAIQMATDMRGVIATSPESPSVIVTVDTTPPTLKNVASFPGDIEISSGQGQTFNLDDIARFFSDPTPLMFAATTTDANVLTLALVLNSITGQYNLSVDALAGGVATVAVTATETAGNQASQSFFVIVRPPQLRAPDLAPSSDSGRAEDDNITNLDVLTFTGDAQAGVDLTIYLRSQFSQTIGRTVVTADGTYTVDVPLDEGEWEARVTQTVNGLESFQSEGIRLEVTVDRTPPDTAGMVSRDRFLDAGETFRVDDVPAFFSDPDRLIYSTTITTTMLPLGVDDPQPLAEVNLDRNNVFTVTGIIDGIAQIKIFAEDVAGNSANQSFLIQVRPRGVPIERPDLIEGDDTGARDDDDITNQTSAITFRGNDAQRGAGVTIVAKLVGGQGEFLEFPLSTSKTLTMAANNGDYSAGISLPQGLWDVTGEQRVGIETSLPSLPLQVLVDTTPPNTVGRTPDVIIEGRIFTLSLPPLFTDTDPLEYDAFSRKPEIISAAVDQMDILILTAGTITGASQIDVAGIDLAGNQAFQSFLASVPSPQLATPDLLAADDSGSSSADNITNQTQVRFRGDDAQSSASITIIATHESGTVVTLRTTSSTTGGYATNLPLDLSVEGVWSITVFQDVGGSISAPSAPLTLTVDTTAPLLSNLRVENMSSALRNFSDGFFNSVDFRALTELKSSDMTPVVVAIADWATNESSTVVTHSVIRNNSIDNPPVVCNGMDENQDQTLANEFINQRSDITAEHLNYETDGFGNHYICATAEDPAGNVGYSTLIGPIRRDTSLPVFSTPNPPSLRLGDTITDRSQTDLINVVTSDTNDIISFAVRASNVTCDADFGDFDISDQIDALDLIRASENYICVRASDAVGNPPAHSGPLQITNQIPSDQLASPDLDENSDSGSSNSDNVTNQITPLTFTGGSAVSGAEVTSYRGRRHDHLRRRSYRRRRYGWHLFRRANPDRRRLECYRNPGIWGRHHLHTQRTFDCYCGHHQPRLHRDFGTYRPSGGPLLQQS